MIEQFFLGKYFIISRLDGVVLSPKFSFGKDGYVENYLDADFYRWKLDNDSIFFFDYKGNLSACFDYRKLTSDCEVVGVWYRHNSQVKLKVYMSSCSNNLTNDEYLFFELKNTKWRFRNSKGHIISNNLHLCEDGFIRGYEHNNEHSWKVIDGQLVFFTVDSEPSNKFFLAKLEGVYSFLEGRHLLGEQEVFHTLELIYGESDYFLTELNAEFILSNNKQTLFVHFNGNANPFNGYKTEEWEFSSLAFKMGGDIIRFSQGYVVSWYLDSIDRILSLLSGVTNNYKRIVFVGMSSGGYNALLVSELLARINSHIEFLSITFNPQTTLEISDRRFVLENYDEFLRPPVLSDFIFNKKQIVNTDVNKFLNENLLNLKHFIFYDKGNESECFYIDRLHNSERLNIFGKDIGLSHFEGTPQVYYSSLEQVYSILK